MINKEIIQSGPVAGTRAVVVKLPFVFLYAFMVFRKISKDLKDRAMHLYASGHVPLEVVKILGVSERSFWRWRANCRRHGTVIGLPALGRGRPRYLTPSATADLYNLLEEYPSIYLDEIQHWLIVAHDVAMARSTLHQNLLDLGLTYKSLRKAAAERDEVAREAFRQFARENWTARQLVFVDESSKDNRTIYRHFGRSVSGQRAVSHESFARGIRYSLVAALTMDGYMTMRAVEGSVNGDEFFDFIVEEVVSLGCSFVSCPLLI